MAASHDHDNGRMTLVRLASGRALTSFETRRQSFHASMLRLNQSIQVGHAQQDDAIAVQVSKAAYVMFWILMFLARCCCIAFLLGTMCIYWFVAHPYMSYYANLLGPESVQHFKPIGVCFGLMALAHGIELVRMVFHSCRLRRFVLDAPPSLDKWNRIHVQDLPPKSSSPRSRIRLIVSALGVRWQRLFHRRGFFGVESDFFHVRFLVRELVEIVSQTIQVYNSSVLIAKLWINHLYVVLMCINCWSTPLLHVSFHKIPALERLLCLCADFVLDAAVSIVVPIIIFAPYYVKFDFAAYNFEIAYLYDDLWFANMVMENQQIFALSIWDFVWKIVPHWSMYSCLSSLNALIRASVVTTMRTTSSNISQAWPPQNSLLSVSSEHSSRAIHPIPEGFSQHETLKSNEEEQRRPVDMPSKVPRKRLHVWTRKQSTRRMRTKGANVLKPLHAMMVLWGMAILVFHIRAIQTSLSVYVPGCKQVTRPWFARNFSCSVLQYNCHQYNTTTVRVQDLEILQATSVVALVLSHCVDLHVPPYLRKFQNLLGIDIYNSTVVEWTRDAAITNTTHTKLMYIIFVRTNMTRLPDGIRYDLPVTMMDFEISVTNLTHLPDDLHDQWRPMSIFYVEHSQLQAFPVTLRHLAVDDLSLIGSLISDIPDFPMDHQGFYTLAVTHTPLKTLPESMGNPNAIGFLNLGYTQLESFPSWMDSVMKTATKIYVHHTPFCATKTEQEIKNEYGLNAILTCSDEGDRVNGKYPLQLMDTRRPFDPRALEA